MTMTRLGVAVAAVGMFITAGTGRAQGVPAAHWSMDEAAGADTLLPDIGTCSIALKNGAVTGVRAVDGTGILMTRGLGQIVGSAATLIPPTDDFGVFLWIAFTNVPGQAHLFSCNNSQVNRANLMIGDDRETLRWFHNGSGDELRSSARLNDGFWHHVGVTRRGGVFQLWVDGRPNGAPSAASSAPISQAVDWRIGSFVNEASGLFNGRMDDLRVYTSTLTDAEVAALFWSYIPAEHRWRFDSVEDGTVFNPDAGWMQAFAKKAPVMDVRAPQGTGIRMEDSNALRIYGSRFLIQATNDFSAFLWMCDDASSAAPLQFLSNNATNTQPGRCSFGLNFSAGNEGKTFFFHPDHTLIGSSTLRDSGWHHVGLVRRGDVMELWVDGDLDGSHDYGAGFALSQTNDWRVGAAASESADFLNGRLDDLRIFTRALDATEAAALYGSYTPPDSLVAHWTFNDAPNKQVLEPAVGWRDIVTSGVMQSGAEGADGTGLWVNSLSRGRILGSKKLLPATNDFTVLMWIRTTNTSTAEKQLFSNNLGQNGRCNLTLDPSSAPNKVIWWANDALGLPGSGGVSAGTGPVVDDGAWHQVGFSRSGKTFRLWVDGANVSEATSAHASPAMSLASDWYIAANAYVADPGGAHYGSVGTGYALMDDLRVYSYSLDATEVAGLYSAFTPLPSGTPAAPQTDHSLTEAQTGGAVVGHLSKVFGESNFFLPSLLVRGSTYLAAATVLNSSANGVHAKIFRSQDGGASWAQLSIVKPLYGGTLFESGGALYLLGCTSDAANTGQLAIRRSTDGGATWTVPADGATGLITSNPGWHFRGGAVLHHGGRMWVYAERRGNTGSTPANVEAGAFSAPDGADLLNAANWTVTDPLAGIHATWGSGTFSGWSNGRAVADTSGTVRMMMTAAAPGGDCVALPATGALPADGLTFNPAVDLALLPGGREIFAVRYDPATKRYWALTNPDSTSRFALFSSATLRDWAFHAVMLELPEGVSGGFAVPDFDFDGEDLAILIRAAYPDQDGASTGAYNHLLFKRVAGFRQLPADKLPGRLLVADTGNNRLWRYSFGEQNNWLFDDGAEPVFAQGAYAGQTLTAPFGLAMAGGAVCVSENAAGGRVLSFSPRGAFQGVMWTPGTAVLPGALAAAGQWLYVADEAGNQVWRVDTATGQSAVWVPQSGAGYTLQELRGLACDGAGNLYVADREADLILRFDTAGSLTGSRSEDAPEALLWDADAGRLLATVFLTPDILSIDTAPSTWVVTKILDNGTGNQRFRGMASAGGHLYFTSDAQNRVNRWDSPTGFRAADIRLSTPGHLLLVPQGGSVYPDVALGTLFILK